MEQSFNIAILPPSYRFCVGPFLFNRIEVRGIGRKVQQGMARFFNGFLHFFSFVKRGTVHNDNTVRWQLRNKILFNPFSKDDGVNGYVK